MGDEILAAELAEEEKRRRKAQEDQEFSKLQVCYLLIAAARSPASSNKTLLYPSICLNEASIYFVLPSSCGLQLRDRTEDKQNNLG